MGDIFAARRMNDQSAGAYSRAIRFDPNLIPAYLRLSSIFVTMHEYDTAIDLLLRAIETHPRNIELVSLAGHTAIMKRDFAQAVELLTDAVRLDSTDLVLRNDLATALMLAKEKDRAVSEWRKILERNPEPNLAQAVMENLRRAESDSTR
jgi:cytochrome c-type biogenesis protein CcmH/NrfG